MARILVVDDEPALRNMLEVVLRRDGHAAAFAANGVEALAKLAADPQIVLVLSDLRMEQMDGLELLRQVKLTRPDVFMIIMTAFAEWDTALRAMRLGAYNFLRKPFDNQAVKTLVNRALDAREHWRAAQTAGQAGEVVHLVGSSQAVQRIQSTIEQVSTTDSTVLVTGESGTGKELVARAVHYASLRADGPLVRINSGALSPNLLESELFGHVKGSFTGAIEDRPGLFALADGGTLFLDEVGDLAPETQVKLLRVLENGEYLPVGGREIRTCNVRVVAATNRDLLQQVQSGAFREDLYYRLAVIPLHLPPLRERPEDVPLLAGHLLARHTVRLRRGVTGFTQDALAAMMAYPWPGNVRELDNRIQRGVALTPAGDIDAPVLFDDAQSQSPHPSRSFKTPLPVPLTPPAGFRRPIGLATTGDEAVAKIMRGEGVDLEGLVTGFERKVVEAALTKTNDNLTDAAQLLGITFRQIRYKVRQLGLR